MNRNVKILSRRFYSPSLKDVVWLERAQLVFLIFHCLQIWQGRRGGAGKKLQMYEKLENLTERLLSNLNSSNLMIQSST